MPLGAPRDEEEPDAEAAPSAAAFAVAQWVPPLLFFVFLGVFGGEPERFPWVTRLGCSCLPARKKRSRKSKVFCSSLVLFSRFQFLFPSVVKGEHSKGGHLPWSFADTEDVSEDVASAAEALARLDLCPVAEPEPSPADPGEQYAAVR